MSKVVALETAGTGVTCNTICPGWVHTPLVQKQIEAKAAEQGISIEQATEDLLIAKQPSQAVCDARTDGRTRRLTSEAAAQMTRDRHPRRWRLGPRSKPRPTGHNHNTGAARPIWSPRRFCVWGDG